MHAPTTSVTGQVLKIVAAHPDAVITGGSGTPGALPYLALAERGYKGQIYGTHALINPDFVRVGGAAVEGLIAPTGPVIVAEQLPATNPIRKVCDGIPRGLPEGQRRRTDRRVLGLLVRRLADLRRRRAARAAQGRARHARSSASRCTKRSTRPRSWSARTASTTSGPTTATAPTSVRVVIVRLDKGQWKLVP